MAWQKTQILMGEIFPLACLLICSQICNIVHTQCCSHVSCQKPQIYRCLTSTSCQFLISLKYRICLVSILFNLMQEHLLSFLYNNLLYISYVNFWCGNLGTPYNKANMTRCRTSVTSSPESILNTLVQDCEWVDVNEGSATPLMLVATIISSNP